MFQTPIRKSMCRKSYQIILRYESALKAARLLSRMEEAYKGIHDIEFIHPVLELEIPEEEL